MAFTSFIETMRRPKKLQQWAPTSAIQAGELDPLNVALDSLQRDMNYNPPMSTPDFMGGGRGGNLSRIGNYEPINEKMNVVYDQGPELFEKQLKMQKRMMDQNQANLDKTREVEALKANDDYIDNRRQNEMKSRKMESDVDLAKRALALQLSDRDKLNIGHQNRLAEIGQQGKNSLAVAEANKLASAADNAAVIEAARIRAGVSGGGNRVTPADKQQQVREMLNQNPEFQQYFEFTDGGYKLKGPDEGTPMNMWETINQRLYNPRGDINLPAVRGIGSAGLGSTNLGSAGVSGNIADRGGPTAPHVTGGLKVQRRRHKTTGQIEISTDGGQTWRRQ